MKNLCWIRRDLRLHDHAALSAALADGETLMVFIFDTNILDKLKSKKDKRISFIIESLKDLEIKLNQKGSSVLLRYGKPQEEILKVCQEYKVKKVFTNRDYEPYAKKRDEEVEKKLKANKVEFYTFKDHVIFEKSEVLTGPGNYYKVFTPYKNKWMEKFLNSGKSISSYPCPLKNLSQIVNKKNILHIDWYKEIGFVEDLPLLKGGSTQGLKRLNSLEDLLDDYEKNRNFPALSGTSLLSTYMRFGNISIRDMLRAALKNDSEGAQKWLSELIWRDFYQMILDAFPYVEKKAFKSEYDHIKWSGKEAQFKSWCNGQTGFPLVDAAMRCLNQTGMLHNRLRMVVASFLCKTLLIDWRKGEKYFAEKLLDYDLAANNGGWQWSSGSGSDAQPYFRIFNPYAQSKKFDPEGTFIRKWIPELQHLSSKDIHRPDHHLAPEYIPPIVNYESSRIQCLKMYSAALRKRK